MEHYFHKCRFIILSFLCYNLTLKVLEFLGLPAKCILRSGCMCPRIRWQAPNAWEPFFFPPKCLSILWIFPPFNSKFFLFVCFAREKLYLPENHHALKYVHRPLFNSRNNKFYSGVSHVFNTAQKLSIIKSAECYKNQNIIVRNFWKLFCLQDCSKWKLRGITFTSLKCHFFASIFCFLISVFSFSLLLLCLLSLFFSGYLSFFSFVLSGGHHFIFYVQNLPTFL